jgi:hypothetical protein
LLPQLVPGDQRQVSKKFIDWMLQGFQAYEIYGTVLWGEMERSEPCILAKTATSVYPDATRSKLYSWVYYY